MLAIQLAQNVVCSSHHTVEQRVAKWLLLSQDRSGCASLSTTQDARANVLALRRESISQIVKPLAQDGAIVPWRGRIEVLSSSRLAHRACECYRLARAILAAQEMDLANIKRLAEIPANVLDPALHLHCDRRRRVDGQPLNSQSANSGLRL